MPKQQRVLAKKAIAALERALVIAHDPNTSQETLDKLKSILQTYHALWFRKRAPQRKARCTPPPKSMTRDRRQFTTSLPLDILEELTEAVNETDRSASDIIEEALRAHLQQSARKLFMQLPSY